MTALLSFWQRGALAICIGLFVSFAILGLRGIGTLQSLELTQYDMTTAALAENSVTKDIVFVALTDTDLAQWGWPVPDNQLALLIKAALSAGARTVGVDIYRDVPAGSGRDTLLDVLNDPRVIVISRLPDEGIPEILAPAGARSGFSDVPIDPDGVARRALLMVNTQDGLALSFPMKLAMAFTGETELKPAPSDPRVLVLGETPLPPLTSGFGPYSDIDASGYQILTQHRQAMPIASTATAEAVLSGDVDLRRKLVLIGLTSHSVKDYFSTPLNRRTGADFAFGGAVHAAITQQLIDHAQDGLAPLRDVSAATTMHLVIVAAIGGAAAVTFLPGVAIAMSVGAVTMVLLAVGLSLAQSYAVLMPVVPVTLAWTISFALAFATLSALARSQRRAMAGIFTSHLSEALATELWKQRKLILSGQKPVSRRLFVTLLLADIEGSTRIGRSMEAQEFMDWVSRLLEELGRIAQKHGGFVEKFTGDGILVVFGAPLPSSSLQERQRDARAAVACAEDMRRAVRTLNNDQGSAPDYKLRIGLNSGEVVAGTLGTEGALRYNVIGDAVNIAARVESWSKSLAADEFGDRPLCMTKATAELIDESKCELLPDMLLHDDGETQIPIFSVSRSARRSGLN